MRDKKNRVKGVIGTIMFHLLLVLALILFGLSTPLPLPGEEGVEVNLGNSDEGMGYVQEEEPAERIQETQAPPPPPPEEEVQEEEIITQDVEEAPSIQEEKERREKRKKRLLKKHRLKKNRLRK